MMFVLTNDVIKYIVTEIKRDSPFWLKLHGFRSIYHKIEIIDDEDEYIYKAYVRKNVLVTKTKQITGILPHPDLRRIIDVIFQEYNISKLIIFIRFSKGSEKYYVKLIPRKREVKVVA